MENKQFIMSKLLKFQKPFYLCVKGDSMVPVINKLDHILVTPCDKSSIKTGDIIVYRKFQDHLTVHRVVNIVKLSDTRFYCITKGDNNDDEDPYRVMNHEIIGIVKMKGLNANEYC